MRTIYVSNGRKDYAQATLVDANGSDLSLATIRVGVSVSKDSPPATWYTPSTVTYPASGKAVVSLLLDETIAPPGSYWLWLDVVDNPTSQPVAASNNNIRTL